MVSYPGMPFINIICEQTGKICQYEMIFLFYTRIKQYIKSKKTIKINSYGLRNKYEARLIRLDEFINYIRTSCVVP
jgi:hypothetical protein